MSTVIDDLVRGTTAINNIEAVLKELGVIESSEQVVIEQFPTRIRGIAMNLLNIIAPSFDKTLQYNIGDIVTYNNGLYRFTDVHVVDAEWSSSIVESVTVADVIGSKTNFSVTGSKLIITES